MRNSSYWRTTAFDRYTFRFLLQPSFSLSLALSLLLQAVVPAGGWAKSRFGEVNEIEVAEDAKDISLIIHGSAMGKCQPVLIKDSKSAKIPKLFLTFDDTTVAAAVQGAHAGRGAISSVDALTLGSASKPLAQVVINFFADVPYKLKRVGDSVVIEIDKSAASKGDVVEEPAIPAAPVIPSRQTIQPGDALYFSVSPAEELSRDITVDQNGKISLPLIGAIDVSGMNAETLARKLTKALSQYVTNPKVDVLIKQFNSQQISLVGQVRSPGGVPYRSNIRLLDVISGGGGFLPGANKSQIRVYRGNGSSRKATIVDVGEALKSGDVTKDFLLQPGDLIDVPKGVSPLTIFGNVEHGGNFEYYKNMRLLDLISLTNGFKDGANYQKIKIFRGEPPNQSVLTVRFGKVLDGHMAANILLEPGDTVYVPTRALWTYSAIATTLAPLTALVLTAATVYLAAKK
jgi:polysaccharide biosynthesis/export protein